MSRYWFFILGLVSFWLLSACPPAASDDGDTWACDEAITHAQDNAQIYSCSEQDCDSMCEIQRSSFEPYGASFVDCCCDEWTRICGGG